MRAPLDVHPSSIIFARVECQFLDRGLPVPDNALEWLIKAQVDGYRAKLVVRLPSGRSQAYIIRKKAFKRVPLAKLHVAHGAIKTGVLDFIDSEKEVLSPHGGNSEVGAKLHLANPPAKSKRPSPSFESEPDFIPLEPSSDSESQSGFDSSSKSRSGSPRPELPAQKMKRHGKPRPPRYFEKPGSDNSSEKRGKVVSE